MKFYIFTVLLSVLWVRKGTCLQCYVCGLVNGTKCESSPDVAQRFLKTCNESETHCYTGKVTVYQRFGFGAPISSIVLACRVGEISGCTFVDGDVDVILGKPRYFASLCSSTCKTDGCNGAAVLPKPTTTSAAPYFSTNSPNTGSLCHGVSCDTPYPYCCNHEGHETEYCCGLDEYQQIQGIARTTQKMIDSAMITQSTLQTSPQVQTNWWAFIVSAIFLIMFIFLIIWRRKVQRGDVEVTLERRNSAVFGYVGQPDRPTPSAPNVPSMILLDGPLATSVHPSAPPEYESLDRPADPLLDFHISLAVLDILSNSLGQETTAVLDSPNESTTIELDRPPAYSSIEFGDDTGRVIDPSLSTPNENDNDVLPSYSSVVSGEPEVI